MQLTEAMLGVGLLLAVVNLGGVSALSASRYPSMPAFLSDSLSGRSWEEVRVFNFYMSHFNSN